MGASPRRLGGRPQARGRSVKRFWAFAEQHPRLASWVLLAIGMMALFLLLAPTSELALGQLLVLLASCTLLAGACAWIISWE